MSSSPSIGFSRSSSFVLGAVFTSLLGLGIYFSAYFLVVANDEMFLRESKAAVRAEYQLLSNAVESLSQSEFVGLIKQKMDEPENLFVYALKNARGELIISNIPYWPTTIEETYEQDLQGYAVPHGDADLSTKSNRLMSEHYDIMAKTGTLRNDLSLFVGRNVDDLEIAQFVAQKFGWVTISIMIFISAVSLGVAFYVFRRIKEMTETAEDIIETGNLSKRLVIDSSWDDLSMLATSLNGMLDEIESLVKGIKSVSDNIAHDLRTPVARLRAHIEQLSEDAQREELLVETDNILSIFNGLLRIAEIEAERQKTAFQINDAQQIFNDVVELYAALAEDKKISLSLEFVPCELFCDRDLLFQAFANVLDNAIKFTPQGGKIELSLSRHNGQVEFVCSDTGPGVPEEYRGDVLVRFFRVDKSRATAGNGLGLAMVGAAVKLHKGTISLSNSDIAESVEGLKCTLSFPVNQ